MNERHETDEQLGSDDERVPFAWSEADTDDAFELTGEGDEGQGLVEFSSRSRSEPVRDLRQVPRRTRDGRIAAAAGLCVGVAVVAVTIWAAGGEPSGGHSDLGDRPKKRAKLPPAPTGRGEKAAPKPTVKNRLERDPPAERPKPKVAGRVNETVGAIQAASPPIPPESGSAESLLETSPATGPTPTPTTSPPAPASASEVREVFGPGF